MGKISGQKVFHILFIYCWKKVRLIDCFFLTNCQFTVGCRYSNMSFMTACAIGICGNLLLASLTPVANLHPVPPRSLYILGKM